jgi:serine/threonine protein kinase
MTMDGPPASGSMASADSGSMIGQTLDGRYRITRKLGEGGMGEVYGAEHIHIEKRFAIKLLKAEIVQNQEAVTRFRQEARSASSIGHNNIIRIEDFGQLGDGRIYMCMELLDGLALNDLITQPLPADRLLNILIQTGHGLAAAHAKGIIHRDMKPENIFVTRGPNGEDVPKLLDFGIAKVSGNDGSQNHLTRTGTIFGTPFYMAPEQALGNPVDARTDIYAMGVIMYECFSGSLPFQGESFMGILTQHITTEPEPVAQRAAKAGRQMPVGVAEIITRCMQKNPAQRFATMDELVNALIGVYRGIAGAGMSTYMEAFPVGSPGHPAQPTPGPLSRPINIGTPPSGAYGMPGPPPGGMPMGTGTPMPMGNPPTGPYAAAQSQPYMPGPSGSYQEAPRKSKMGIVIAIMAVVIVGGAITAFVLLGKSEDKPGAGSQVAQGSDVGSSAGSDVIAKGGVTPNGSDVLRGSDTIPAGSGAIVPNGSDTVPAGSGKDPWNGGSDAGSAGSDHAGSDTTVPAAKPVSVLLSSNVMAFEIWENGTKIGDGPDTEDVVPGAPRTVVLKAKGYKDKTVVLDGTKKKLSVKLDRVPGSSTGNTGNTGSNGGHTPPKMDCSDTIKDPHDLACRKQFCAHHTDDPRCDVE